MTLARIRSPMCTTPVSTPPASTTSTLVMACASIFSAASAPRPSGAMRGGGGCMPGPAVAVRRSAPASMRRRRSPSVKIPSTWPAASTTAEAPRPLALISRMRSLKEASGATRGTSLPVRMTSLTWVSSLRPSAPPGCERAKSSWRKPRASSRATASASPMASWAVVLAVGAKFRGQASRSTLQSSTRSAWRASVDCSPPVIAISGAPRRLSTGRMAVSSPLSPLLEIARTRSSPVTMPRSPWLASAGCTKNAGVPVDASVAAILRPTWPLLPMPITTTRPRACSTINTASANTPSTRAASPVSAAASMSKVSRARRRACSASKGGSVAGTGVIRWILSTGHACAGGRFFALALAWTLLRTENTEGRRKARIASNHVLTRPHLALPVGRSAGCCGLPQPQAATHARLPGCGGAHRPPCAGADAELGRGAAPGRVWRGVPDVRHRAGVQPAQAARHAAPGVRPGTDAGGADDGGGHRRGTGALPLGGRRVGYGLADGAGALGRDGDEQYGHCGQAHGRAGRARKRTWPPRDGYSAVPGSGRGAAAGVDPRAEFLVRPAADRAGVGAGQGHGAGGHSAHGRAAVHALVAHAGGAAQERGAVHAQPAADHAGPGLADRTGGAEPGAGRLHRGGAGAGPADGAAGGQAGDHPGAGPQHGGHHGRGPAHRALPGPGGGVRICAAVAHAGQRAGAARADEPHPCGHGAVHAGDAVSHHVQQPHRDEAGGQRLAAAVAADDVHRAQIHQHQQTRDHLRLRPLRTKPGANAGA